MSSPLGSRKSTRKMRTCGEKFIPERNSPLARCYWELAPLSILAYSNNISNLGTLELDRRAAPGWNDGNGAWLEEERIMSIQSDRWIREQALEHGMIEPFSEKQVREGVISYGLSSYGYDLRVSDEFKIFTNVNSAIIDPKAFDERSFVSV